MRLTVVLAYFLHNWQLLWGSFQTCHFISVLLLCGHTYFFGFIITSLKLLRILIEAKWLILILFPPFVFIHTY